MCDVAATGKSSYGCFCQSARGTAPYNLRAQSPAGRRPIFSQPRRKQAFVCQTRRSKMPTRFSQHLIYKKQSTLSALKKADLVISPPRASLPLGDEGGAGYVAGALAQGGKGAAAVCSSGSVLFAANNPPAFLHCAVLRERNKAAQQAKA